MNHVGNQCNCLLFATLACFMCCLRSMYIPMFNHSNAPTATQHPNNLDHLGICSLVLSVMPQPEILMTPACSSRSNGHGRIRGAGRSRGSPKTTSRRPNPASWELFSASPCQSVTQTTSFQVGVSLLSINTVPSGSLPLASFISFGLFGVEVGSLWLAFFSGHGDSGPSGLTGGLRADGYKAARSTPLRYF
jgi:hypothetical protein